MVDEFKRFLKKTWLERSNSIGVVNKLFGSFKIPQVCQWN